MNAIMHRDYELNVPAYIYGFGNRIEIQTSGLFGDVQPENFPVAGHTPQEVQHSFFKFTAQMMIKDLRNYHPQVLERFYVWVKDGTCQMWERNVLGIEIDNNAFFNQKPDYIHYNPVIAGIGELPEEYACSSASLYLRNATPWKWLAKWGD